MDLGRTQRVITLGLLMSVPLCPRQPAHPEGGRVEQMRVESLDALLARARERDRSLVTPSGKELQRTTAAARLLLHAIAERRSLAHARRALEAEHLELVHTKLGDAPAVAVVEMDEHRTGRGIYIIREGAPVREWLVEVPHSFFDEDTLPIGRAIAAQGARGLFVNTVHRYPNGIPPPRASASDEAPGASPSDLAHVSESVWQAFTLATIESFPKTIVVQLHGFADRADPEHADTAVIVSPSIVSRGAQTADAFATRLAQGLAGLEVRLFPRDTHALGATTNAQAALVSSHPSARFVHVEMSRTLRRRLVAEPALLGAFVDAVWSGKDE